MNLSISEKFKFSFKKYDTLEGLQQHSLSFGNLIWLKNIEVDACLTAEPVDRAEKEYDVSFFQDPAADGVILPFEGLFQLENALDDQTGVSGGITQGTR